MKVSCCNELSGIKVIDIRRVLSGPMATRLFSEQGANVMHISRVLILYFCIITVNRTKKKICFHRS